MMLSQRKANRLKNFDYSSNGVYFLTICTQGKEKLLCDIVGDGVLDVPECKLSKAGRIVEKYIVSINNADGVFVDKYVIMPNHVHLLLRVDNSGTSRTPSPTNALVPHVVSTFKRFCSKEYGANFFQRSYHDHIVRDENDYQKIWNYIDSNPLRWKDDCFYTED